MKMTTDTMELVSLVVFKARAQEAGSYLLHAGFFHPVDIREVERELGSLSQLEIGQEFDRFDRLQQKTGGLARQLNVELAASRDIGGLTYDGSAAALKKIEDDVTDRQVRKEQLKEAIRVDQELLSRVRETLPFPIEQGREYSLLFVSAGRMEEKNIPVLERSLAGSAYVLYPFARTKTQVSALFLGLRRDREALQTVLTDVGWREEDAKGGQLLTEEAQAQMRERVSANGRRIAELDAEIAEFKHGRKEELSRIYSFCSLNKSLAEAKRYAVATDQTVIFSGWVPAENKQKILSEVAGMFDNSYIESRSVEETGVPKEDVPVRFGRNPLLRPFSLLVESYGVPRYGTLDPTVFVAISFVFMFGLMFGDLGQGLVFAAIGAFLLKNKNSLLRQFAALLFYCGISSAVFGFLFGSVFGFEFHSAWEKPMEDVMGILRFSIYGGIALISVGIVINIVNALRDRDYVRALFDKAGLIAGIVYWCAIAVISRVMFERQMVPPAVYAVITAGAGLLFIFPMAEFFMHKHSEPLAKNAEGAVHSSFTESFMESLLGMLELGMGYLANTVSFVRMGAFALAHAALFLAVFQIAKMFRGGESAAVIFFGNIGIMVLEGVVVSIQSLRLNYYEFFSKFFITGKTVFKPLSINVETPGA
jgi:V/A-type H+/Na+-transporting ATPase subunit I